MKCVYTVVETLYLLIIVLGIAKGDECYGAEFSEDVWDCPDFDNIHMKCEPLELGMVEGKDGELGLNGHLNLNAPIDDGTMMNVEIWKIMDVGKEYLYHAQGDICGSLKDDSTPWYPLIEAMKIQDCPISVNNYNITDMKISLEHVKDMITHEMCGEYSIQLSMTKGLVKLSCHELGITVSEKQC